MAMSAQAEVERCSRCVRSTTEQPEVVVVVVGPAAPAPASVSPAGSTAGSAPVSRPLPAHSALHFDATHVAIALRAALVAHSGAASFVLRQT